MTVARFDKLQIKSAKFVAEISTNNAAAELKKDHTVLLTLGLLLMEHGNVGATHP